jgi:hypothetical protein
MKLDRQIQRIFGLEKSSLPSLSASSPDDGTTLAYAGYPTLRQIGLFLSVPALERWRKERTLVFPQDCCVCSQAAHRYLPACIDSGRLCFHRRERTIEEVPHCENHGHRYEAQLLAMVSLWSDLVCQVSLIGLNEAFLSKTSEFNQSGDIPPPWRAFPGQSPASSGWRQGNGEYWLLHSWSPFWKRMPRVEQQQYLQRWDVPAEWLSWMMGSE